MMAALPWKNALGVLVVVALVVTVGAQTAQAFLIDENITPWTTAASGTRPANGQAGVLTWSIVPDGTSTPNQPGLPTGNSDLVSFLDGNFGGAPSGADPLDLQLRPWFGMIESAFQRWTDISGLTFQYEENDDSATHGSVAGALNVRGDIRLAGIIIDGDPPTAGTDTLAFTYLPLSGDSNGDVVFDTGNGEFFSDPISGHLKLRNTIMHELGHSIGARHVISNSDTLLLEPRIHTDIEGPQLDEIRAAQYHFGDVFEDAFDGLGNQAAPLATDLGQLLPGTPITLGADADVPTQAIAPDATDFVSISNLGDRDYYSFNVDSSASLDVSLRPLGGRFTQGPEDETPVMFDAAARSDLSFTLFDTDGSTVLAFSDEGGLGVTELLEDVSLDEAGQYFVRVSGSAATVQLYQLDLSVDSSSFLSADFDRDLDVDQDDLQILQSAFATTALGDTDADGDTDGEDFLVWQRQKLVDPPMFDVADLDQDFDVDGADFLLIQSTDPALLPQWSQQYGSGSDTTFLSADLDQDFDVDGADFLLIQSTDPALLPQWIQQYDSGSGTNVSSQAVPEPTSALLLLLGLAMGRWVFLHKGQEERD